MLWWKRRKDVPRVEPLLRMSVLALRECAPPLDALEKARRMKLTVESITANDRHVFADTVSIIMEAGSQLAFISEETVQALASVCMGWWFTGTPRNANEVVKQTLAVCDVVEAVDGVLFDIIAMRFWDVEHLKSLKASSSVITHHVNVHCVSSEPGLNWMHTHGMKKFGRPDLQIFNVPSERNSVGFYMLMDTAHYLGMMGAEIAHDDTMQWTEEGKAYGIFKLEHECHEEHFHNAVFTIYDYDPATQTVGKGVNAILDELAAEYEGLQDDEGS